MQKFLIRALVAILALSPAVASAQQFPTVPDRSVIGRLGTGSGSGPSQAIPLSTLFNNQQIGTYVLSIASLRALTPGIFPLVYVGGFSSTGDGGQGYFTWNGLSSATDDGGTVIAPNAGGTGRWLRNLGGSNINVQWYGIKGAGSTENAAAVTNALNAAVALKGCLYFPSTTSRYLLSTALVVPDGTHGLCIRGDAKGTPVGGSGAGTVIATTASSAIDMTGVALGGTGSISDIVIENMQLVATGTSGKALKVWNVDQIRMNNLILDATQGSGLDMAGTANFSGANIAAYSTGGPPVRFSQDAVGAQSNGPGNLDTVHCSITNGASPCAQLQGDLLGVTLRNLYTSWVNSTAAAAVDIDGPTSGTPVGALVIDSIHTESTYNTTNTGATIRVGATNKFGSLTITGGNLWGHGNGTRYQRDGVQVVAARNVKINGTIFSKLSATNGFSRGAIRLESTFPAAGDLYSFSGNQADVSGTLYSDANSRCTGAADCVYETVRINTLSLGNALSPLNGGTGASLTLTIGDLLQASSSTQLARLAAVATGNVLLSGGVGTASAWGKVGLTTHVTGVLPIANGGTNCSSASGTCLDNITGFASTGLLSRTGAGTYAQRTVTGTAGQIAVSNGDGVSGNPTLSFDQSTAMSTYSPTLSCGSGTLTSASATGVSTQLAGKAVMVIVNITITTNGTCASRLEATLPFTANRSSAFASSNSGTGAGLSALVSTSISTTKILIFTPGSAYPGADGVSIVVAGIFERT